ncbi:MFS family permease [Bradyrhizobium diazoefficiens]|jgi:MFS family permease|uniref:MFS transporter n=1 Tax=Bradyrhizobium TaxID=374 RepID=UPI00272DB210|nr:MFS transporter [Bradyrhizobium diazoefficiens]WLA59336.1 MFS transporter [Bradyrhizobium diazoefficiens]
MRMVSPRTSALHYGWIVLGAGTFGSFMTLPGQTAGVSVFFDPITADLGISRTSASIAYAVGTLAGILPAPVIGRWIDRRGPRLTATIIAGGLALACTLMAAVQTAMMLLIGFALLRGAAIGGLSLVSQQVVNLWFVRRRGIAAAAASLGLAAGSMTFPKLIDSLISLYGWRGAYLALAGLVALTIVPVAAALFRDRPEKYGLSTDAGLPPTTQDLREEPSLTRKQALRTGVFWLLCAAGFLTNAIAPRSCSITSQSCGRPELRIATRCYCCRFLPAFKPLRHSAPDFWWIAMNPGTWFRSRCSCLRWRRLFRRLAAASPSVCCTR